MDWTYCKTVIGKLGQTTLYLHTLQHTSSLNYPTHYLTPYCLISCCLILYCLNHGAGPDISSFPMRPMPKTKTLVHCKESGQCRHVRSLLQYMVIVVFFFFLSTLPF